MISECGRKKTSFYPGSCEFSVKQSWEGKKSTNETKFLDGSERAGTAQ